LLGRKARRYQKHEQKPLISRKRQTVYETKDKHNSQTQKTKKIKKLKKLNKNKKIIF
jgi:hypothetical protein